MGVHVWPGVLGLALLQEDTGHDFVELGDEFEEFVVGKVLEGKFTLAGVSRIRLAQHGVAISRNNPAALERVPDELVQLFG